MTQAFIPSHQPSGALISADPTATKIEQLTLLTALPASAHLTSQEAALYLATTPEVLRTWRSTGKGPRSKGRGHFIPHVRLRRSGNGWVMRDLYSSDMGVVVQTPAHFIVVGFGGGAIIDRTKVGTLRDAAWLLCAYLHLDAAYRIADPLLQPVPPNSNAFMVLWADAGVELAPLPTWKSGGPAAGYCDLKGHGTFDLVRCDGHWEVERRGDRLRLSEPMGQLTFPGWFKTPDDAMEALMATAAGWTKYAWA
jgi:hypothetical protein